MTLPTWLLVYLAVVVAAGLLAGRFIHVGNPCGEDAESEGLRTYGSRERS